MKNSIKFKLFISITFILLITTFIGYIINSKLYKDYYISQQKSNLLQSAKIINNTINKNPIKLDNIIENIKENNGYVIYFTTFNQKRRFGNGEAHLSGPLFKDSINKQIHDELLDSNYTFNIYYNEELSNNFLKIYFLVNQNRVLVIESPVEIINTSAKFNLRFYLYISLFTILLGGIFSYIFANKFTKPIIELNNQAKSIANLDFKNNFESNKKDEIGTLGKNMNILSNKLETTINELNQDLNRKEELEKTRKAFIANVSHEFKTPIALIKGHAEGLLYDINKKEYIDIIIDETNKMDHLVKDLLEISNLESGNIKLNITSFDISSLIDEILYKYNRVFIEKNINVSIEKNDIIMVNADIKKIEEVITNFINNAIRHIDNNKELKISVEELNDEIKVNVFNSGKNIPKAHLSNIWDSFYKVDQSRNRESGSTGLGLFIVKIIIENHNGSFGVDNKKNGVNFYFKLKND